MFEENFLAEALLVVEKAVREMGDELRAHFGKSDVTHTKSHLANDVVTIMDTKTEEHIKKRLFAFAPQIGYQGEEGGVQSAGSQSWLVDPIDGTGHFVRGMPFCSTMVALIDEGEVVLGAIYDFTRDDFYAAIAGQGAHLNGKPIQVSQRPLTDAYVFLETNTSYAENIPALTALRERCVIMNTINTGFEFAMVASGKIEARICKDPYGHDWDYAAGSLLVKEAGGIVRNLGSETYDYRNHNFIAACPASYKGIIEGSFFS